MEKDQELLEKIVKGIVDNPEDVEIKRSVDDMGVLLRLWVNKEDMGLVVGRAGSHASAIKLIMKLFGFKNESRVSVRIEEPK